MNYSTGRDECPRMPRAALNIARAIVKLLTNRPRLFPCFLHSLSLSVSLYLSTFRTGWKMFANKVFGGQWWKVTTRHKSEVVIGKEKRKRMQRMFAPPLFTILLFTRASLRGIFTREYLERERNSSFLSVSFRSRTRRKF